MLLSDKYPFLTEYFTRALSTNVRALPQSILFYGNDADAQFTFATEIARLLNCTSDKSDNCECLNCRWIRENSHPALLRFLLSAHFLWELLLSASLPKQLLQPVVLFLLRSLLRFPLLPFQEVLHK